MNKLLGNIIGPVGCIVYFIWGLLQFSALVCLFTNIVGLPWPLAVPISAILAYIPVIGTILGIAGAIKAWGWSLGSSIFLFFGPLIVAVVISLVQSIFESLSAGSKEKLHTNSRSGDTADKNETHIPVYIQEELEKFNWGAAFSPVLWGAFNESYFIAGVSFIGHLICKALDIALGPFGVIITLIAGFAWFWFCGAKGNEWAWKNKQWDSFENFQRTQKRWAFAGACLTLSFWILLSTVFAWKNEPLHYSLSNSKSNMPQVTTDPSNKGLSPYDMSLSNKDTARDPSNKPPDETLDKFYSPSFDCQRHLNKAEEAICRSPGLSELDRKMGEIYAQIANSNTISMASLGHNQYKWLSARNACIVGMLPDACIEASYHKRIAELQTLQNKPAPSVSVTSGIARHAKSDPKKFSNCEGFSKEDVPNYLKKYCE